MAPKFTPAIADRVHYVSYGTPGGEYGQACRAAIVTAVHPTRPGQLSLCVLSPTGLHFDESVQQDVGKAGGTWHWPALDA